MKKSLIASTMTLGICSLLSAQVGINIGENVTPTVTLQIDGKPGDTGAQDGVLVPRITRVQLAAKDDTVYSANQNGALIFITDVSGTSTPKTADITSTGFYYYNSSTSKWVPVTPASSEAKDYGNGSFTPNAVQIPVQTALDWSIYSKYNYIELTTNGNNATLSFPPPSAFSNNTVYIRNTTPYIVSYDSGNGNMNGVSDLGSISPAGAQQFYSDGSRWYLMAGRL